MPFPKDIDTAFRNFATQLTTDLTCAGDHPVDPRTLLPQTEGNLWSELNLHGNLICPLSLGISRHGKKQSRRNDNPNSLFH